jgi:hypothetical protein
MRIAWTAPLFAWEALEDSPSLRTTRDLLATIPDGKLLAALRRHRGHGRDDYSVETLWGVLLLTVALRHPTIESCLGELRRNEGLRRLIGIESEGKVPRKWNMSRFVRVLGQEPHWTLLQEMTGEMVETLARIVKDLGEETAGDATGLSARCDHLQKRSRGPAALPQPTGGKKEYTDEEGTVVRVVEWFGYKLHLLVDKRHEVILAWLITSAHAADNDVLPRLLQRAQARLPKGRIQTLAYDRAADDVAVHQGLQESGIAAIIENRTLWTDELERMLPGATGRSNIVYDEAGTLYCYDKESDPPVRHRMAYIGHEPSQGDAEVSLPGHA